MIEQWKATLNKKLKIMDFMDVSKVFDSLNHSLMLVKSNVCGFDNNELYSKLFNKRISKM